MKASLPHTVQPGRSIIFFIVSYTLVANYIPVNATSISANEHESHYVCDLLFNNSTEIQPDVRSTDTQGATCVSPAERVPPAVNVAIP